MDHPEENIPRREVHPFVAHAWHLGELIERPVEILKQPVSGVEVVFGDEFPNILKVPERAPGELESLHARCRRRSAL